MFFRFFIRNKYLRILHGYAWDLNSLFLFSHPLACYNGRPARFRLLATFNLRLQLVFCCADIMSTLNMSYLPVPVSMFECLWTLESPITYFIFVTSIADGKGRLVCDGSCDACKHRETRSAFLTTDIPECGDNNDHSEDR